MRSKTIKELHLYEQIAENISKKILEGVFRVGESLPPVRKLSNDLGVSISSVMQAYVLLEQEGLVKSKPQSGYYVLPHLHKCAPEPDNSYFNISIRNYDGEELVAEVNEDSVVSSVVPLGAGTPCVENLPGGKLNQILASICREDKNFGIGYEFPPGFYKLRRQISKQSLKWGGVDTPDDIIITTGATEALFLALKAVSKPGDVIVTESPVYFGILQLAQNLGLKIIEIPTDIHEGIDIEVLGKVLKSHTVAAGIFCLNISNPLCSIMPTEKKKQLYKLFSSKGIPIIEDDVYGELYFGTTRPKPIKAFDNEGIVIYISSFSKTVAPSYRIGWISPGEHYEKVKRLKFAFSLATPSLLQAAMAEFLKQDLYEHSLKKLRKTYSKQISYVSNCVSEFFPIGTKISRPQGGYYLWIELHKSIDSIKLQKYALKKHISIAPGPLFSTTSKFSNFIRLSCSHPVTPKIKDAVKTLGHLCSYVM